MFAPGRMPWQSIIPSGELLRAYAAGRFPMAVDDGLIEWFSPDPRGIIPLDEFHVPRRLTRSMRQRRFDVTIDRDFPAVILACADRDSTWIDDCLCRSYCRLFETGNAHSVECRVQGRLVGGVYGVSLGGAFFGESMFSLARDASKVALVHLLQRLRHQGYRLFDVQWTTSHLVQFGAVDIPRRSYLARLKHAVGLNVAFSGTDEATLQSEA